MRTQKANYIGSVALVFGIILFTTGCSVQKNSLLSSTSSSSAALQIVGATSVRVGDSTDYTLQNTSTTDTSIAWSVNGINGGTNATGTISSSGVYVPPSVLGTVQHVTITATSATGSSRTASLNVELLNPLPVIQSAIGTDTGAGFVDIEVKGTGFTTGSSATIEGVTATARAFSSTSMQILLPATALPSSVISVAVQNPQPGAAASEAVVVSVTRASRPSIVPDLGSPNLPTTSYDYVAYAVTSLPQHYAAPGGAVAVTDNTPVTNPITNAGATLGRVLFYDKRLSVNNTIACASCHQQANGFADTASLSKGVQGGLTGRHTPGISNAKYYARGHFFWDERANTLEDQVLQPIQNPVEMGMTLADVSPKLAAVNFYPALFQAAFGSPDVTSDRISKALSQFVRSMVTYHSKYDSAFAPNGGPPNFAGVFTASELRGQTLFEGAGGVGCARCHGTAAHISATIQNNGLDLVTTDVGAGNGQFKSPSLRNVALRGTFMHDGRFKSLAEVVEFYNSGVQANPNLSQLLRNPNGTPRRLNLSAQDKTDLVAFLATLTDNSFITDPRFSNPF